MTLDDTVKRAVRTAAEEIATKNRESVPGCAPDKYEEIIWKHLGRIMPILEVDQRHNLVYIQLPCELKRTASRTERLNAGWEGAEIRLDYDNQSRLIGIELDGFKLN